MKVGVRRKAREKRYVTRIQLVEAEAAVMEVASARKESTWRGSWSQEPTGRRVWSTALRSGAEGGESSTPTSDMQAAVGEAAASGGVPPRPRRLPPQPRGRSGNERGDGRTGRALNAGCVTASLATRYRWRWVGAR